MKQKNKNILNNGEIQIKDIEKVSYDDLISIVNDHVVFYNNEEKKKDLGYFFQNKNHLKFVIAPLLDTHNYGESENKRIQDKYIKYAKKHKADLIGVYPIKNENKYNFCFVLWPYDIIKTVKATKNPGVKVKLYDIYFAIFHNYSSDLKPRTRKCKYKHTCLSEERFKLDYLQVKHNKSKIELTKDFIKSSEEDLSLCELQQIINTKSRGTKLQKDFRKNLLKKYKCKCAMCQINIEKLLIASHIISVKNILEEDISDNEKKKKIKDHENGLLLCSLHDALFDKHLISFDKNGKIKISSNISKELYGELKISTEINIDPKLYNNDYMNYHLKKLLK